MGLPRAMNNLGLIFYNNKSSQNGQANNENNL